jgi:RsiW-degrading membrane proteinase PrsW (M82 family)
MHWVLLLLPVLPGILWLVYAYRQDAYEPEPKLWILGAFLFGALMMWPAGWASAKLSGLCRLPHIPVADMVAGGDIVTLLVSLLVITGPVEELAKWLVVRVFCYPSHEFNEPLDGIIYGSSAALGFASFENIWYLASAHGAKQYALTYVLRALTSVPMHGLCGALFGYGLGNAKLRRGSSLPYLAAAALAHGLFDVAASVSLLAGILLLPPMAAIVYLMIHAHRARSPFRPGEPGAVRRALDRAEGAGRKAAGLALRCVMCSAVWLAPTGNECSRCGGSMSRAPRVCGRCGERVTNAAAQPAETTSSDDRGPSCLRCGGLLL